ncbi:MAG: CRISPR-associated endonuclease Cas3'' [Planctomycetes bacterium]|nr:CRISPR-associated endonuclease Cas3'' [Planctomycetota bacterium]
MKEETLLCFWAKLGKSAYSERHPLICHMIDVAMVAKQMWNSVLGPRVRQRVAKLLRLNEDIAGCWLSFWVGGHDIGKAIPGFQCPIGTSQQNYRDARKALESSGFDFPNVPQLSRKPHWVVTRCVLQDLLSGPQSWAGLDATFARRVATAVGGHHGVFPASFGGDLGGDVLGGPRWSRARTTLLDSLAQVLRLPSGRPESPPEEAHWFFMFLAGLTSVADWIGSNRRLFPSCAENVELAAYAQEAEGKAVRG